MGIKISGRNRRKGKNIVMNLNEKKAYISAYAESKQEVERLEEELKELEERNIVWTKEEKEMQQAIKSKIIKERYEKLKKFEEARRKIESLEKNEEKDVLVYRHLRRLKWKEIELKMGYEERHLRRIYEKALEHLKL